MAARTWHKRDRARRHALSAVAIVALYLGAPALPGCSFVFLEAAPPAPATPEEARRPVHCTTSVAAPVIDTVLAGFEVVRTGVALGAGEHAYDDYPVSRGADVGVGLALTALFTASAIYGFVGTHACDDARTAQRAAVAQEQEDYRRPPRPAIVPAPAGAY
jgi:hypothetical protein